MPQKTYNVRIIRFAFLKLGPYCIKMESFFLKYKCVQQQYLSQKTGEAIDIWSIQHTLINCFCLEDSNGHLAPCLLILSQCANWYVHGNCLYRARLRLR